MASPPTLLTLNYLIIESLQKFHHYYTDDFKVECPTDSGQYVVIIEVSQELTCRLKHIFLHDTEGRHPVFG
ncbi:MAG: hypothetical protein ACYDBB_23015 [Armatimonadota bacterium]